ncbi:MAG: LamG domain-containing protein, partial [Deltaproteobacteria bacterium]|nr:LamG domain-containing protein [Deltaproteobacteria bacterium]
MDPGLDHETELNTHTPISYWKLDEGAGLTAADQSGLSSGTYTNGVSLGGTGIPDGGSAATFDGFNDYVSIAHNDAYLINEGTIQLWFKADNPVADQALLDKNVLGAGTGGHTKIYLDASGHITAFLEENIDGTNLTVYSIDGGLVSADEWHQVVFTFGSGGMQLYLDGELVGTNGYTGGLGDNSGPGPGNFEDIRLGAYNQDTGFFQGQIDEVAIIGAPLDSADVQNLYDAGLNIGETSVDTVDIVVDVNVVPTLSLPGGPLNFLEGDGPTVIDAAAAVSDPDSPDFDGGTLTVEFT